MVSPFGLEFQFLLKWPKISKICNEKKLQATHGGAQITKCGRKTIPKQVLPVISEPFGYQKKSQIHMRRKDGPNQAIA